MVHIFCVTFKSDDGLKVMGHILILVSSDSAKPLRQEHLSKVGALLKVRSLQWNWLKLGKAAEIVLEIPPEKWSQSSLEELLENDRIDSFLIPDDGHRKKKLLISDMDSTMVVGETLDDLAATCGLKSEVAAITEKAMSGQLNFQDALRTRVLMLKGLTEVALSDTTKEIEFMPGAEVLVRIMKEHGAFCVLVSGGFTCFTGPVAEQLGFHTHHGNVLEFSDKKLTGGVVGPILDYHAKLAYLQQYASDHQLSEVDCLAVGDGANDLSMIAAAGLGVGYHPKPYLKERADNSILYGDLSALLYVQGYTEF